MVGTGKAGDGLVIYIGRHRAVAHVAAAYQIGDRWHWQCTCGSGAAVRDRLPPWVTPELSAKRSAAGHVGNAGRPRRSGYKITTPRRPSIPGRKGSVSGTTPEPQPEPTLGQRKILLIGCADKISVNERDQFFHRGASQRLRGPDVRACEALGWLERTSYGTLRATEAGRLALRLADGVESTTVQQRIDNEREVSA